MKKFLLHSMLQETGGVIVIGKNMPTILYLLHLEDQSQWRRPVMYQLKSGKLIDINLALFKEDPSPLKMAILDPVQKAQVGF